MAPSVAALLARLSYSDVLDPVVLQEVRRIAAEHAFDDAQAFADDLVQREMLTPFQALALLRQPPRPLVLGNYVLLSELGEGGMGQVYRAWHRRLKRQVALKTLTDARVRMPESLARFRLEAEAAGRLEHPNIVATYDADEAHGVQFLAMQYIDGMTLDRLVALHGPLAIDDAVALIVQAAQGLAFAHEQDVVHRDIKPSNLILGVDGVVRILDMGLARTALLGDEGGEKPDHVVMGSVDFLAPDQMQLNAPTDSRGDVYSLGCSLYFLLTARPVYPGRSPLLRIMAHREQAIPSLCDARPEVTQDVNAVFRKMLAKEPSDRYQSVAAVIDALNNCVDRPFSEPSRLKALVPSGTSPLTKPPVVFGERECDAEDATAPLLPSILARSVSGTAMRRRRVMVAVILTLVCVSVLVSWLVIPWASNGAPAGAGTPAEVPPIHRGDEADHRAALWALELGGVVQINLDGVWLAVSRPADLPAEPLRLMSVQLGGDTKVNDDGLANLRGVAGLQMIWLGGAAISDAGLIHLEGLTELRYLSLTKTSVSDAGLAVLGRLHNLRTLRLESTEISDAGLPSLLPLQELEFLSLRDTKVTDASVSLLSQLRNVAQLDLRQTLVTSQGVESLQRAEPQSKIRFQ